MGNSARNREVRIYKLTPAGRKPLERKVGAFERLMAGITKVMRARES
jgi:DNA-binding MarR family transcriptional regulator